MKEHSIILLIILSFYYMARSQEGGLAPPSATMSELPELIPTPESLALFRQITQTGKRSDGN